MADPIPEVLNFCTRCFADAEQTHCYNCGSGNTSVPIPQWAAEYIRENASWVGRRVYPTDQDIQEARELRYLRTVAPQAPLEIEKLSDGGFCAQRGAETLYSFPTEGEARRAGVQLLRYPVPGGFK